MGIDARLVFQVPGTPDPAPIKVWSALMCISLGAKNFFQNRKTGRQALHLTEHYSFDEDLGDLKVTPDGQTYQQDGPDLVAAPGTYLLQASLWSRFYGVGYERGDLLTIIAVAEWAEANLPEVIVYYGGDSSGVVATVFDQAARNALKAHYYSSAGRDYFRRDGVSIPGDELPRPNLADCQLCVPGYQITRYGWGLNYAAWSCAVCGESFVTRDAGETWGKPDKDGM